MSELGIKPENSNCGVIALNMTINHLGAGLDGPTFFL